MPLASLKWESAYKKKWYLNFTEVYMWGLLSWRHLESHIGESYSFGCSAQFPILWEQSSPTALSICAFVVGQPGTRDPGFSMWPGLASQYGPSPHAEQFQSFCWNCQEWKTFFPLLLCWCQDIGLELPAALLPPPSESQVARKANSKESRAACWML